MPLQADSKVLRLFCFGGDDDTGLNLLIPNLKSAGFHLELFYNLV
jgi:hypothetical protein